MLMHFLLAHIFCVVFIVSIVNTKPHGGFTPQNTYLRFKKFHASFRTISISTHMAFYAKTHNNKNPWLTLPLKSCAQKAKKTSYRQRSTVQIRDRCQWTNRLLLQQPAVATAAGSCCEVSYTQSIGVVQWMFWLPTCRVRGEWLRWWSKRYR